jgi:hypothetical protein
MEKHLSSWENIHSLSWVKEHQENQEEPDDHEKDEKDEKDQNEVDDQKEKPGVTFQDSQDGDHHRQSVNNTHHHDHDPPNVPSSWQQLDQ